MGKSDEYDNRKRKSFKMKHLIFIDTNIFLDFYRQRKTDLALSQLRHIEQNIGEIITGNEVEMEFKKTDRKSSKKL